MKKKHLILKRPITDLEVSREFLDMCSSNKFTTLSEIANYSTSELLNKTDFNMHIMIELVEMLEQNGLGRILKE